MLKENTIEVSLENYKNRKLKKKQLHDLRKE